MAYHELEPGLPMKWPHELKLYVSAKQQLSHMTYSDTFWRIASAIAKARAYWYSDQFAKVLHVSNVFDACVVLTRMAIHFAYDLVTGMYLIHRVLDGLHEAKKIFNYKSSHAYISIVDVLMAMFAYDQKIANDVDTHAAMCAAHEPCYNAELDYWSTPQVAGDLMTCALRSAMCLTGCVVRLNLEVVTKACRKPEVFKGFIRMPDKPKMPPNEVWGNYIFDLAAMWFIVRRLKTAFINYDDRELIHALHRAKMWSMTAGLANSANRLIRFEPHLKDTLQRIVKVACTLHYMYIRAHDLAFGALNVKKYATKNAMKRAIGRMSAQVFAAWGSDVKVDVPEVGTATFVDNMFAYTTLTAMQAAIQSPTGAVLIGALGEDLQYAGLIGEMSEKTCKSDAHMWASVAHAKCWTSNLEAILPTEEDMNERVWPYIDTAPWIPTLADLEAELEAFKKKFWSSKAKNDKDEIEKIMATLAM